jgi:tRNA-2-methylthio-N6-dimethylallyladenosine synthase
MPSVFIKTYGCQMNERDSETVAAGFIARGYALAASEEAADVVLLNTCSVRASAEQKALGKMEQLLARRRRGHTHQVLGFLGCMAQSRGPELLDRAPGVDLVLGTQRFHRVALYADQALRGALAGVCDVSTESSAAGAGHEHQLPPPDRARSVTAFVSIMQGCNEPCTFCLVPATRGRERSRPLEAIVEECRELAGRGVREVTLLGQNVTSYGRRSLPASEGCSPFVRLLEAVQAVAGIERIRFTSPHPRGYGDDLVAAYGRLSKLCEQAHLPLQSGSNRVLRLMRRGYTRERYLELVAKLRNAAPRLGLGTDLIVGFPDETEADFAETLDLVRQVQFDYAYVFKYSPRPHTPAAAHPNPVPAETAAARHARLLQLVTEIGQRRLQTLVGERVQVLVEGPSHKNPARLQGRTRCGKNVVFEGSPRHVGRLLEVRIARASAVALHGDPVILNLD